jgi:hypothetical protein
MEVVVDVGLKALEGIIIGNQQLVKALDLSTLRDRLTILTWYEKNKEDIDEIIFF